MTNLFVNTITEKANTTMQGGMKSYLSTLNCNLDFYAVSGNLNITKTDLISKFTSALNEDENLAIRNLLHMRDVRTGKGIRSNSRFLLIWLAANKPDLITKTKLIERMVQLGRWDDIFEVLRQTNKRPSNFVINYIAEELSKETPNPLLCKWLPRQSTAVQKRTSNYDILPKLLAERLKLTPKQYRQLVVKHTNVVETQMCNNKWKDINFQHVPSQAFRIYKNAFKNHTPDLFTEFLNKVEKGEAKVNAGAVWPHELLKEVRPDGGRNVYDQATSAQWNSLPDFIKDGKSILPMIDVSGSMTCRAYSSYTCSTVAVALGLYTAERNKSAFKNMFLNFSTQPAFGIVKDTQTLTSKINTITSTGWSGSTNIIAAFEAILEHAIQHQISQNDMPEILVVFTDMAFNSHKSSSTVQELLVKKYNAAGYVPPMTVWWNLSGNPSVPVIDTTSNTCIVSGFSPSNFSAILGVEVMTPVEVMQTALLQDKYNYC